MSNGRFFRTYDSDDTDGNSNSDTDDHVMSSVRFYPRADDNDDTDGHSNSDNGDHVMRSVSILPLVTTVMIPTVTVTVTLMIT